MKKLLLFITMITMLLLAGCSTAPEKTPFAEGKLPVAVSFHAMDRLAKRLAATMSISTSSFPMAKNLMISSPKHLI